MRGRLTVGHQVLVLGIGVRVPASQKVFSFKKLPFWQFFCYDKYMNKKQKKEIISIPKKAMFGIAPAIAIIAVLISKGNIGPLMLFMIGIAVGIFIGRGFFENN